MTFLSTLDFLLPTLDFLLSTLDFLLSTFYSRLLLSTFTLDFYSRLSTFTLDSRLLDTLQNTCQRLTRERAYSPVLKYNEGLRKSQGQR
jgi:hypothetical protein